MHIDHTTLRTNHLEETRDFFLQVFDLKEGPRPATIAARIKGHWLYHKDAPLVHLIESIPYPDAPIGHSPEAIDHTAFFMEDYDGFRNKLDTLHIKYSSMDLPELGEKRIFLRTPTHILLEVVFRITTPASFSA
jgi:glyoxylase I family protein